MIPLSRLVRICSGEQKIGRLFKIGATRFSIAGVDHNTRNNPELWRQPRCFSAGMTGAEPIPRGGIVEVPLAQTGEGIADCELLRWFVKEGDNVEEFQPICEVQSDKASIEISSRYKGKVTKVKFMPGEVVKVGETLLEVMLDGESGSTSWSSSSPSTDETLASPLEVVLDGASDSTSCSSSSPSKDKTLATSAVRALAKQLGLNLNDVHGSGKDGRVMKEDLLKLVSAKESLEEVLSVITPPSTAPELDASARACHVSIKVGDDEDEVIPVRGFRRAMAKTMTAAVVIPHFHYMEDLNVDSLVKLKADIQQTTGLKLTYLPFLIKALSLTLQKYPILNSNVSEGASEIRCKKWHNIGVAMATSNGLVVPNVKHVQTLSVKEISEEVTRLSRLAGDNKLSPEDVTGGTITVSNFGAIGGKFGSPVLNLPEAAILGIGRIQKLPRFDVHGKVYPASIMSVTWGADHRVIDGATIANFCNEWKYLVEHPEEWLLHLR